MDTSKAVLCLDDEEEVCELVEHFLKEHRVIATHHPYVALELVQREPFDLAVVDLHLPEMDGLEFCRRVRRVSHGMPIVVCSGRGGPSDVEAATQAGAAAYFVKPVDPEAFKACVESLLAATASRCDPHS